MANNADKLKQHHYAKREEQNPIQQLFVAQVGFLHRCAQSQGSKTPSFQFQLMTVEALKVSLPKLIFRHPVPQLFSRTSNNRLLYNFRVS